jgi:hypothetical protein
VDDEPALHAQGVARAARRLDDLQRETGRASGVVLACLRVAEDHLEPAGFAADEGLAALARHPLVELLLGLHGGVEIVELHHPAVDPADGRVAAHHRHLASLALRGRHAMLQDHHDWHDAALDGLEGLEKDPLRHVTRRRVLRGDGREEAAEALLAQPGWNLDRLRAELAHEGRVRRPARHGDLAGEALEQHEAPRVEVGARRQRLAAQLLRRGVRRCPHELAAGGEAHGFRGERPSGEASEPEVEHLGVAPETGLRHHDVVGLHVAMDDRLCVRARERIQHLGHQVQRLARLEPPLGLENLAQRAARDVLEHRVEEPVAGLPRVDEPHHVGVREGGAEPHLAPEPLALILRVGRAPPLARAEDLERHILAGRQLAGAMHPPERTRAERREDLVPALEDGATAHARIGDHASSRCAQLPP